MWISIIGRSYARVSSGNSNATLVFKIENPRTKPSIQLPRTLTFVSILVLSLFKINFSLGAAQQLVRVRSETRIELFASDSSRPDKITGTLRDSLRTPLPNQRVKVGAIPATASETRLVTTGPNGVFTISVALENRARGIWARFDGTEFYEAAEAAIGSGEIGSPTRSESITAEETTSDRELFPYEFEKEGAERPNVLWLLIPMFLCFGLVFAIKRRERKPNSKFKPENEPLRYPGIKTSPPARYARKERTSIAGTIRDLYSGDVVPDAKLTLVGGLDTSIALDISSEGFFSSPNMRPGKWEIQVTAEGYVETMKEFLIPHRGEWTNVRIHMVSTRSLALQSYRKVALALLPTPQLWDVWTARETLHNSRRIIRSSSLFRSLVERVERSLYRRYPPSIEEAKIIETEASTALIEISQSETDYTVTHRR